MTLFSQDGSINKLSCVSGIRRIDRQDLGVRCDSSFDDIVDGDLIGRVGWLFSLNDNGREIKGDGGNGGRIEYRSGDAG